MIDLPRIYNEEWRTQERGHIFNDRVDQLIEVARGLIAGPQERPAERRESARPLVSPIHINYSPWIWTGNTNVYNFGGERRKEEKSEENQRRNLTLLAIVGAVLAGIFAYQAGSSAPKQAGVTRKLDTIEDLTEELNREMDQYSDGNSYEIKNNHLNIISELLKDTNQLAGVVHRSATWDLGLKVALFVGGITLFSGSALALAGIKLGYLLNIAGAVTAVVAGCGLLFKTGFAEGEREEIQGSQQKIRQDIAAIQRIQLPYCWEGEQYGAQPVVWTLKLIAK